MPLDREKFSSLMRKQRQARKEYDALIHSITVTHEPSGLPMEVLTRDNWPKIEAATAGMKAADEAVLRFLRGEPD